MNKPRILLVDDHELMLAALRSVLDGETEIVGIATDGMDAISACEQLRPDLALLDVRLPSMNGIETALRIRQVSPSTRIVFVTMLTDRAHVDAAFAAGGSAYVVKQAAGRELRDAIEAVMNGGSYVSPRIAARFDAATPRLAGRKPMDAGLTARQREVLRLIADGKSMKEIAAILHISARTVEFHRYSMFEQLGLRTTAELTRYAVVHGIIADQGATSGTGSFEDGGQAYTA
jgi:DNA-binding NarL/FixJ family response regulator